MILAVDTSGKTASAAVSENGVLLGYRMLYTARSHSQILLPMVKDLLAETGHTVQDVDTFAVAVGPGSYTGLRIGIAAMQAMAYAGQKNCVGVSTLEGLAWNLCGTKGLLCACLTARQNLCYCAFFESDGQRVTRRTDDKVMPVEEIAAQIAAYGETVTVIGDGISLLRPICEAAVPAPMHLCNQSACGICMAAAQKEPCTPEELVVNYLQEVKIG